MPCHASMSSSPIPKMQKTQNHFQRFVACEKIVCQISIHCCCLYDSLFCGSRNVPARISLILALRIFNASMDFQSRTANRTRFASIDITPEYICPFVSLFHFLVPRTRHGEEGERRYLELRITTQQSNSKIIHSTRFMSIVVPIPRLHEIVIRHPFHRAVGLLVHRGRVQRDRLVVGHVAPAFAFPREQLRVEAPCDHRVDYCLVDTVVVVFFGDCEELALAAAGSGSVWVSLLVHGVGGSGIAR